MKEGSCGATAASASESKHTVICTTDSYHSANIPSSLRLEKGGRKRLSMHIRLRRGIGDRRRGMGGRD